MSDLQIYRDIAERTGGNKGQTHHHSERSLHILHKLADPPYEETEKSQAENRKQHLNPDAAIGAHAERHTGILNIYKLEPLAYH